MLSRIGRVIDRNRERIGMILFIIGVFWLMGVAGADDFNSMQHVFNPVLPLVMKTLLGLLITGAGVRILNGGDQDENRI